MRLNLGCGNKKIPGWINVDKVAACNPDEVVDLERFPWPWADNAVEEVRLVHVLEHLGATADIYFGIIKELYRVCRDGAVVSILVPHPRHDNYLGDPTHVRPITYQSLRLFSQERNRETIAAGHSDTPLGIYLNVDFAITKLELQLDEPWLGRYNRGELPADELEHVVRSYNNVITQTAVTMHAIKPAGRIN